MLKFPDVLQPAPQLLSGGAEIFRYAAIGTSIPHPKVLKPPNVWSGACLYLEKTELYIGGKQ